MSIRITPKIMRILTLLEAGPKYGRQFALIAPDLFFSNSEINQDGMQSKTAAMSNIYSLLKRAEIAGLIEELHNFVPVETSSLDQDSGKRKYYTLTIKGKESLVSARKMLNPQEEF